MQDTSWVVPLKAFFTDFPNMLGKPLKSHRARQSLLKKNTDLDRHH